MRTTPLRDARRAMVATRSENPIKVCVTMVCGCVLILIIYPTPGTFEQ